MISSKTTILIDGSFMMHRSSESLYSRLPSATSYDLAYSMLKDFKAIIRDLQPFGAQIIYALDSMSWRKSASPEYKANRTKKNDISDIYEAHNKMLDSVKEAGINIIRVNNAEADDIIFKWSSTLAIDGSDVIIISEDKDLMQLVYSYQNKGTNIFQYRPISKKLIVPTGFLKDVMSSLLNGEEVIDTFNQFQFWIKSKNLNLCEVNADEISFIKMLTGDKGDNVTSIYEYRKNERIYTFTENQAFKVLNLYKYQLNIDELLNEENLIHLNECIQFVLKLDLDFKEKIKLNYSLVVLNNNSFPKEILEGLNHSVKRTLNPLNINMLLNCKILSTDSDIKIIDDKQTIINDSNQSIDSFWEDLLIK
jgi:5'-3' exonuclease